MHLKRSLPLFLLVLLALSSVPYFMATPAMQPGMTGQPSLPNLTILAVPAGQVLLFRARAKGCKSTLATRPRTNLELPILTRS